MKNNSKFLILAMWLILAIGFISYKVTLAAFRSSASNTNNTFAASSTFPSPCPSPSVTHVVINEVFSKGNKENEWVELFNPTCSPIDVSGWTIKDHTSDTDTLPSVSPIPAKGFGVIIPSQSTVSIPSSAVTIQLGNNNIGSGLNDPGDELHLKDTLNNTVDEMSYGNDHSIFTISAPTSTQTQSRHPNGVDTDTAADWALENLSIGTTNP